MQIGTTHFSEPQHTVLFKHPRDGSQAKDRLQVSTVRPVAKSSSVFLLLHTHTALLKAMGLILTSLHSPAWLLQNEQLDQY